MHGRGAGVQQDLRQPPAADVVAHLSRLGPPLHGLEQHLQLRLERVGQIGGASGGEREVVERERTHDLGAELAGPEAGEEHPDLFDRVVLLRHPVALPRRRGGDVLLEQGEEQVVLARERLVEAAERELRPVDDVLDREREPTGLVEQLHRGLHEAVALVERPALRLDQ